MPASGEMIRALNYVEDISATVRRIVPAISSMSSDERKKVAEALRGSITNLNEIIGQLEKAQ
jgi:hypothetical protein